MSSRRLALADSQTALETGPRALESVPSREKALPSAVLVESASGIATQTR